MQTWKDNSLDSCSVCDNLLQLNFSLESDCEVWKLLKFLLSIFGYKNSPIKIFRKNCTDVGGWRVWCEEWIIADQ